MTPWANAAPAAGAPSRATHPTARVARIVQTLSTHFDVPGLLAETICCTRDLCEADGASLLLVDPDSGNLYFDVVSGESEHSLKRVMLKPGAGIAGHVAQTGEALWVPDVRDCPLFDAAADRLSGFVTGSIVAVPLVLNDELVGVLEAVRSVARAPFEAATVACLEMLAPHVAIALRTARVTSELRDAQARLLEHNRDLESKVAQRTALISKAKAEWERTFDAISEPIALLDGFTVRRANLAYAAQAGLNVRELIGRTCHAVLAGRESPCPGCPLAGARSGAMGAELPLGGRGTFRLSAFPLAESNPDTVVVHYRDVTAQRALEGRLHETERLAAVGQLASGTAHEINNPLGFVISNLSGLQALLRDLEDTLGDNPGVQAQLTPLLEDGREMLAESLVGARRVQTIVRALRDLSRLEIGKIEPSNVNSAVTRVVQSLWGDKRDRVQVNLGADSLAHIAPLQLDQALSHVLDNARKAVAGGGRIFIDTGADDQTVWVCVRDEGCGIAAEHLRRVFEPFFTTRGVGQGVGLGLTAAYGLVKRAGGTIDAQSERGVGSSFTLRLPCIPPVAAPPSNVEPRPERAASPG